MGTLHLLIVASLVAPAPDMPDPMGPEWTAPAPPPTPALGRVATGGTTTSTSPTATSTRPFDAATPVVVIHHDPPASGLGRRDRRLLWAAGALGIASVPPFVVLVLADAKMRRIEVEFETRRMEDPMGPFPYDLAREYRRQRDIAIGTSVAGGLLAVVGVVLGLVATRNYRAKRGTRRVITMRGLSSSAGAS